MKIWIKHGEEVVLSFKHDMTMAIINSEYLHLLSVNTKKYSLPISQLDMEKQLTGKVPLTAKILTNDRLWGQ